MPAGRDREGRQVKPAKYKKITTLLSFTFCTLDRDVAIQNFPLMIKNSSVDMMAKTGAPWPRCRGAVGSGGDPRDWGG